MPSIPAQIFEFIGVWGGSVLSVLVVGGSLVTTWHILLWKRNERAAAGWIALAWLSPLVGFTLYIIVGINRIRRRARALRAELVHYFESQGVISISARELAAQLPENIRHLATIAHVVESDAPRQILPGNAITLLRNGDETYPAIIDAIANAKSSVHLVTYIFDNDTWGARIADALVEAAQRGVAVRVLVDATGLRYSFPHIGKRFEGTPVKFTRFNPASLIPPRILTINMRNHRKVIVVDGQIGFTGGMNFRDDCVIRDDPSTPTRDIHFKVEGPVVSNLQEVFAEDWTFATKEKLEGTPWFPILEPVGDIYARGITDGPDEDIDRLRWALMAAVNAARESVRIVTPYFLPDESLRDALVVAAKRGVDVQVVLPRMSNLPFVDWASMGHLDSLLEHGVKIFRVAELGFDHSKLMVVDSAFVILGSANWDPRSLRLNFEFNVECYDPEFGEEMSQFVLERIQRGELYTLVDHNRRSMLQRLLHSGWRLLAPYL